MLTVYVCSCPSFLPPSLYTTAYGTIDSHIYTHKRTHTRSQSNKAEDFDIGAALRTASSTQSFLINLGSALEHASAQLLVEASSSSSDDCAAANDALECVAVIAKHAAEQFFAHNAASCRRSMDEAAAQAGPGMHAVDVGIARRAKSTTAKVSNVRYEGFLKVKDALLEASVRLHDEALLVKEQYPSLQEHVARLCETWWNSGVQGRERLMAQALPYLVVRALTTLKAADVKRLCAVRGALALFDYADPSCDSIKGLMLRTAFCPAFLRAADGRRFIAFLFSLDPKLVEELMAIIRNQVPAGRKSVLEAFGDILFRAWRDLDGACLDQWEACVQELMQSAILASTRTMSSALNVLLATLHSNRRHKGFDATLMRLYEPILFRAIDAPNPNVRRNAMQVLGDAFPLMNAEGELVEIEACLGKQTSVVFAAMMDDVPAVRAAAVTAACHILDRCWELLASSTCASWIERMAFQLAFDASSQDVRAAVITGLTQLVDNPHAQPVLEKVLPKLAPLVDDSSARVRVAILDMLLAVRSIRAIKFYEVVPLQTLFERLAVDKAVISRRIVRLLLPSYFPPGSSVEESASRCIGLLQSSPDAGSTLMRMLYLEGMPMDEISALAVSLCGHLERAVLDATTTTAAGKRGKRNRQEQHRDASTSPVASALETVTPELWERIATGIADVYEGMSPTLEKQQQCGRRDKAATSTGTYPSAAVVASLFEQAPTAAATEAIVRLCSFVPSTGMGMIAKDFMDALGFAVASEATIGAADEQRAALMLCALCRWGYTRQVVGAICGGLASIGVNGASWDNASLECPKAAFLVGALIEMPTTRLAVYANGQWQTVVNALRECVRHGLDAMMTGSASIAHVRPLAVAFLKASLHSSMVRTMDERRTDEDDNTHDNAESLSVDGALEELFAWCMSNAEVDLESRVGIFQTSLALAAEAAALKSVRVETSTKILDWVMAAMEWLEYDENEQNDEVDKCVGHLGRFLYFSANTHTLRPKVHEVAMKVQDIAVRHDGFVTALKPWYGQLAEVDKLSKSSFAPLLQSGEQLAC